MNNINEKLQGNRTLQLEKLIISEYNTRSSFVDQNHVNFLANQIKERGYHPNRSLLINMICDVKGDLCNYRIVAGVHRFEAAKQVGMIEVPCLIYRNLTPEEETILDLWDNEMDESHKPFHFLEVSDHYRYLKEVKDWSNRKIAEAKGIDRETVNIRVRIANIPEKAKSIIRGGNHGCHFIERHFREICKLSDPHIITICYEIAEQGTKSENGELDSQGNVIQPMKQKDIKKRVVELLALEEQGKVLEIKFPNMISPPDEIKHQQDQTSNDPDTWLLSNYSKKFPGGFSPIPNWLFDVVAPNLTANEWKLLTCIYRKTLGWKKKEFKVQTSQLVEYTGIGKKEALKCEKSLKSKGLIEVETKGKGKNTYKIFSLKSPSDKGEMYDKKSEVAEAGSEGHSEGAEAGSEGHSEGHSEAAGNILKNDDLSNSTSDGHPSGKTNSKKLPKNNKQQKQILENNKSIGLDVEEILNKASKDGVVFYDNTKDEIIDRLKALNFSNPEKFVNTHNIEEIDAQIQHLYFLINEKGKEIPNKAAWLREAVENHFVPPSDFKSLEQKEREKAERQRTIKEREEFENREKQIRETYEQCVYEIIEKLKDEKGEENLKREALNRYPLEVNLNNKDLVDSIISNYVKDVLNAFPDFEDWRQQVNL